MLEGIVVGWEGIEDVFLANLAMKNPFILVGRHGICKTKVSKEIAKIYQNDTDSHFRFYDATKDDLISIAGIPIPEELKKGKLAFSHHDRTIWEARCIVVDEISRANKENSNLWLEILEEHTCFGVKLPYETFIASLPFEEPIIVEEDGEIKHTKIGELVEKYQKKKEKEHAVYAFSFNPITERVERTKVTAFLKHKTESPIYQLMTESGRRVSVTGSHSLLKLTPSGVKLVIAGSLRKGDSILTANRISGFNPKSIGSSKGIKISTEIAWLFGFFCAEGSAFIHKRQTGILKNGAPKISQASIVNFSNKNRELLEKTARIIQEVFDVKMGFSKDKRTNVWNLTVSNPKLLGFFSSCRLDKLYIKGKKGYRKQVPEFIFQSPKPIIRHFLDGYLAGDGCKAHREILAWSSGSMELRDGIATLFRLFGKKVKIYQQKQRGSRQEIYLGYIRNVEGDSALTMLEEFRSISNERIVQIEISPPEEWVYDLEVRNGDNSKFDTFLSRDWILLHNTMNPETYASTFQLDEALIDRFYAVIPVPDFQQARADEIAEIIKLNFGNRENGVGVTEIRAKLDTARENYAKLRSDEEFFEAVIAFVSRFMEVLLSQGKGGGVTIKKSGGDFFVSPRKAIQTTEEILGICATQMALQNETLSKSIVEDSAYKALIYTICIPMQFEEGGIKKLFEQMKAILFQFNMSEADKIRLKLVGNEKQVYEYFMKNHEKIQKHLKVDEVEKLVGQLTKFARGENKVLDFFHCLSKMSGLEEWKRQLGSEIIIILEKRLKNFSRKMVLDQVIVSKRDVEKFEKLEKFIQSFKTLPFPEEATRFLLEEVPSDPYRPEGWGKELGEKFEQKFGNI